MGAVRAQNPEIRGRFIVQDLPSTLAAVPRPPPAGVEFMPYDMFTPQPIRGAHVYYYRHLVPILQEQPRSKLLLVDLVLPDADVGMQEAVRDLSMFPIGGLERNEGQWRALLRESGLRIRRIWRGSEPEACVECAVDRSALGADL
ncbi:Uu.00g080770.m01.CDS01 [Anthostomella pinea]|uniref:Uu.00g080770.m01.CDS01 n=1 Tax=Anthostomella pinea TaxID=933095 RepID=A0AAI8VL18_9PEZI|nr:Uu.00g080770.m01.CDS01 [Anthostomella pinea]